MTDSKPVPGKSRREGTAEKEEIFTDFSSFFMNESEYCSLINSIVK